MNIEDILKKERTKLNDLSLLLNNDTQILIFGTGNLGEKIGRFLLANKKKVIAFSDNNNAKWNTEFLGLEILNPEFIDKKILLNVVVIVSIWSPGHSFKTTKQQFEQLGAPHVFNAATLMQLYPTDLLPHFHFQTPQYFINHSNELKEVYSILADDESKAQYLSHVDCRVNQNFEGLPAADIDNQYFCDVVRLTEKEVFLDAGAYTGDTFLDFVKRAPLFNQYIALEPDPQNLEKLSKVISNSNNIDKTKIYPFAVGAENCLLSFDATGGGGAAINKNGLIEVECKRIDDKFYTDSPTYLKFDIEGAELDALKGAKKTIIRYKPKLAVCIYHLPDDLWQIPLYIKDEFPFYKLYLRTHQFDGLDFVLYAIPN